MADPIGCIRSQKKKKQERKIYGEYLSPPAKLVTN